MQKWTTFIHSDLEVCLLGDCKLHITIAGRAQSHEFSAQHQKEKGRICAYAKHVRTFCLLMSKHCDMPAYSIHSKSAILNDVQHNVLYSGQTLIPCYTRG